MNHTQCRSASDDFLRDPLVVSPRRPSGPVSGFLVGAYCNEDGLILARRLVFPLGIAPGDLVALVNSGGYLMHIVESSSHQMPLARTVIHRDGGFAADPIDRAGSHPGARP